MTPQEQARVFAAMLLCGAGVGMMHDALALIRGLLRAGRAMTGAADLLLGAAAAAGICLCALRMQTQAARWYVFAGIICGALMYRVTIGALVGKVVSLWRKKFPKSRKVDENVQRPAGNSEME